VTSTSVSWAAARQALLEATATIMGDGRDGVRLADLLTARALAEQRGLLEPFDPSQGQRRQLESTVALFPIPRGSASKRAWTVAAQRADELTEPMSGTDWAYAWSASSQACDPGRKGRGAYSTPPALAAVMTERALAGTTSRTTILDPSAGHGALLVAAYLALRKRGVPTTEAVASLYGVELDAHARELCCLTLWLVADDRRCELDAIGRRIVLGNALRAEWRAAAPDRRSSPGTAAFTWEETFEDVFANGGFEVVIANPPWESLRHRVPSTDEEWMERSLTHERLGRSIDTARGLPPLFSAQGRGDRNLFKAFVELFPHLLTDGGRLVALLPGAFSSDLGLKPARELYLERMAVDRWTGFENLAGHFPIDGRYKFGVLSARRSDAGTRQVDMRFLARDAREATTAAHVRLSRGRLVKLGGPSLIFPEVSDRAELNVLARATTAGSGFFDAGGSFGQILYRREVDLTLDRRAGRFEHVLEARARGFRPRADGTWSKGDTELVPLIEGRMVGSFDFFQKSWRGGAGRSAKWSRNDDAGLAVCSPQFLAPRRSPSHPRLAICDVTSATNTRTMLATWLPNWPCGNTAPVLEVAEDRLALALLAVLGSMTFDWLLRRIASGLHLNRFYLESTPLPTLDSSDVDTLASFSLSKLRSLPRYLDLGPADALPDVRDRVSGPPPDDATVETVVARGYGLDAAHLSRVLSPDRDDRKGLWRYFVTEPDAVRVAEDSIRLLEAA
jgi:N-6 DNA Methylase